MPRPLLVALLALLLLPAAASAQSVVDDDPAVTSSAPGRLNVAARAPDGTIVYRFYDITAGAWSPWEAVRGITATSGPALAADDDGTLHVFARNGDGLAESVRSPAGWSAWTTPQTGQLATGPGASNRQGTPELDVGVLGLDGAFYHLFKPAPGAVWSAFDRRPYSGTTAPGMVSRGTGKLDAFIRADDGSILDVRYVPGESWSVATVTGATVVGAITAISRATDQMDVYARGTDGAIYGATYNGSAWTPFTRFNLNAGTSAPAAVATGPSRVDMVVRDGTTLYHRFYDGQPGADVGGWKAFEAVGPIVAPVDRGAPNGSGAGDGATLTAQLSTKGAKARTFRLGRTVTAGGLLRNAAGGPVAGATIQLLGRNLATGARDRVIGTATTTAQGLWLARLTAGPGVAITARYVAFANDAAPAASATVKARTRAAVRLSVSRKRVRPGSRLRFRGRLLGGAIPGKGKLVTLQARERGRWNTFANPRAGRKGRFSARYRFRSRPSRPVRLRFRAVVPVDASYPFTRGVSASRTVTLLPR